MAFSYTNALGLSLRSSDTATKALFGTAGKDLLLGTAANDIMRGYGGGDIYKGGLGG
ncbi:hypothetical protein ACFSTD_15245 [Novosphingobium colocasiae]